MFCKYCGFQIDDDSVFCSKCGGQQTATQQKSFNQKSNKPEPVPFNIEAKLEETNELNLYDPTYVKNPGPAIAGVILLILTLAINFQVLPFISLSEDSDILFKLYLLIFIAPVRISACTYCFKKAKELNRNSGLWFLFAFLTPSIALITIGFQKRYLYPRYYNHLPYSKKAIVNNNIGNFFIKRKKFKNALLFVNKALEIDNTFHEAYDTRGYINYLLDNNNEALNDLNVSIEINDEDGIKFYHRGLVYKEMGKHNDALKNMKTALGKGYQPAIDYID